MLVLKRKFGQSISFHPLKGRIVNEILEVTGYSNQDFQFKPITFGSPSLCSRENLR